MQSGFITPARHPCGHNTCMLILRPSSTLETTTLYKCLGLSIQILFIPDNCFFWCIYILANLYITYACIFCPFPLSNYEHLKKLGDFKICL